MGRVTVAAVTLALLALVPEAKLAALGRTPAERPAPSERSSLADPNVPQDPGARVQHHLREIAPIVEHFETVLAKDCPRFASRAEWRAWIDDELDRVVLLVAHVEQAWVEAKRTPDDDVRRLAVAELGLPGRHQDGRRLHHEAPIAVDPRQVIHEPTQVQVFAEESHSVAPGHRRQRTGAPIP